MWFMYSKEGKERKGKGDGLVEGNALAALLGPLTGSLDWFP